MSFRKTITVLALAGAAFLGSVAASAPADAATVHHTAGVSSPSWFCWPGFC